MKLLSALIFFPITFGFGAGNEPNVSTTNREKSQRTRRSLIFPSGSIMQLSLGIGVNPNVQDSIININFGFQQNVPLPTNITQLRYPPMGRSGRKLHPQDLHSLLENMFESYGFNGSECLQKCICQMAASELSYDGMFESILHHILTPSRHAASVDSLSKKMLLYYNAEDRGVNGADCQEIYIFCPVSPLDLFLIPDLFTMH